MPYKGRHSDAVGVMCKLPPDLHARAAERLAVDRLTWQELVTYAVARYIVDDVPPPDPTEVALAVREATKKRRAKAKA